MDCERETTMQYVMKTIVKWTSDCRPGLLAGLLAGLVLSVAPTGDLSAQEKENRISYVISNADGLLADVEYMVKDLAGRTKTWNELIKENIDLFLDGVNREEPVRIDMMFDEKNGEFYRPFFPVSDLRDFRNNVDAFGITNKPRSRVLYTCTNAFDGFMLIHEDYGIFIPKDKLSLIDPDAPEIVDPIQPLLDAKYDAGVLIDHDAAGMEQRRSSLAEVRNQVLAGIKKKSTESPEEFEYRKLLALNRILEFETLYVEIERLEAGWITDPAKGSGVGTLNISGIEGTVLAETFSKIPELKSRFHVVPPVKDFVASGDMLYPIDAPHQDRFTSTIKAYQPIADQKIDRKDDLNADQKKAAKEAVDKTVKILEKGITMGVFDGFIEMRKAEPGKSESLHEAVIGLRATSGREIDEVVKLLPKIRDSFKAKVDSETVGDFHIHEIVLESNVPPMIDSLFGTPCHIFLATSENMVLFSLGEKSLPWLKETLELVNNSTEEKTPELFLEFKGHVGPFAKALSARKPNQDLVKFRDAVIEAFSEKFTDDYIEMTDEYVDGTIKGTLNAEPGLLRLLGIMVANFAEENL
ncbi:hypothetical protein [Rubinisphaera margarita]|uniref:hypothetical protein n=1 Tax=Rubinisphaera margarita TaxID=2909586 RepID=UPI001EE93FE7|nr:hypothetical protein [Rubinisphaera margarita]MCG6154323.1 hypothetical protein [Rubinisphaera margarita]